MIKYTLRCSKDHRFDSWFRDSATYEKQEKRRLLECPVCGDSRVERALVAPNVSAKGNRKADPIGARRRTEEAATPAEAPAQPVATVPPNMPPELRKVLLELRGQVEKNCDYVGDKFADEARKIHYGETDKRGIYGETSDEEASALADEGIEFGRLPWVPKGN